MAEGKDSGDLFSSSKLVADAAASVFQHKNTDNIDKKEVAGTAADILHAASSYGKLEDRPAGQYIKKAEDYLQNFSSGPTAGVEKPAGDSPAPAPSDDAPKHAEPAEAPKEPEPVPAAKEGESEGFRLDDVVKGAEQLVEKQGGEGGSAGAGGLFKMAEGFLK